MARITTEAQLDREIRRTLRRYGREGVALAKKLTPSATGYTRSRWTYSITGLPEPSLEIRPKTQRALKTLELALGPRRKKWIVSSGKMMKFSVESPSAAWASKGGVIFVRRYLQKSRKGDYRIDKGIARTVVKAMNAVVHVLSRSNFYGEVSWIVE